MSHPYLPAVIDLVRQAGVVTLPFWRCDTAVTAKLDDSPVTAADLAAHHLLLAGLNALAPEIPVLSEEAGFGAHQLELLAELSLSPGYMSQKIQVVLARDLYAQSLPGDEPEPLRVDRVDLGELSALVEHPQFSEGRALAALYLARDLLTQRGVFQP